MKTFKLSAQITISIYTEVKAKNLKEAISESENRGVEAYQWGAHEQSSEIWVSDEYDGEPEDIQES